MGEPPLACDHPASPSRLLWPRSQQMPCNPQQQARFINARCGKHRLRTWHRHPVHPTMTCGRVRRGERDVRVERPSPLPCSALGGRGPHPTPLCCATLSASLCLAPHPQEMGPGPCYLCYTAPPPSLCPGMTKRWGVQGGEVPLLILDSQPPSAPEPMEAGGREKGLMSNPGLDSGEEPGLQED